MNNRIKELRNALNMTQQDFGKRIGVTRDAIAGYERGVTIKEPIVKLICREFNVSIAWLKEGVGDMFNEYPNMLLDEIADEYHLDEIQKNIVKTYLELDDDEKDVLTNFLLKALGK